jgi:hypothetical protein
VNPYVWVLTDRDEGVLGVFRRQAGAVRHLEGIDPSSPLEHVRDDGSRCDFAMRYRLEQMKVQ